MISPATPPRLLQCWALRAHTNHNGLFRAWRAAEPFSSPEKGIPAVFTIREATALRAAGFTHLAVTQGPGPACIIRL